MQLEVWCTRIQKLRYKQQKTKLWMQSEHSILTAQKLPILHKNKFYRVSQGKVLRFKL